MIFYNCIGAFEVPDRKKIPEADIIMETRKGVAVSYAPAQIAVWTLKKIKMRSVCYRILKSYKDTPHGRSGGTWTRGLLVPNQARYQTALHPEDENIQPRPDIFSMAARLGFEPRQTESESVVLPLHNSAIC